MRTHKYGAKATVVDGIRFASQKEAMRYGELKLLEKAGEIHALEVQPRFVLAAPRVMYGHVVSGSSLNAMPRVGEYRGDFQYCGCKRGDKCQQSQLVVEDVKGYDTPLSKWKRRHVRAQYGIEVRIV